MTSTPASPYGNLLCDPMLLDLFAGQSQFTDFLKFEIALTRALGKTGLTDATLALAAAEKMEGFTPDPASIAKAVLRDGLPVPDYVRQLKAFVGKEMAAAVHTGATSQDLIDTATALALKAANHVLQQRLHNTTASLRTLAQQYGDTIMMGRTRMQEALPIRVAHRLETWVAPLDELLSALTTLQSRVECLQLGGPVGDRTGFGDKADAVSAEVAQSLGLTNAPRSWHSERGNLAGYANWLSRVTGSLGKIGQDMALMAQQGLDEIAFTGGGASSAMPHKQNPVLAETLVTLARYNATQLSGMHHALVHEQERSGAAWALEWMILPQMVSATGTALTHATTLAESVTRIGKP